MHRDIATRTFPGRLFFLCDFEPDRLDVVLRSEGETNIDVWFTVTHFLAAPVAFHGLEITDVGEAEGSSLLEALDWGPVPQYAVVTRLRNLETPERSGFIVSHGLRVVEHDYPFRYAFSFFVGRIPTMGMRRLIEDHPDLSWQEIERLAEER